MIDQQEGDSMVCRACGRDARASEGYPCKDCGTFICIRCNFRGVQRCKACQQTATVTPASSGATQ